MKENAVGEKGGWSGQICCGSNTLRNSQGEERGFAFTMVFQSLQSPLETRKTYKHPPYFSRGSSKSKQLAFCLEATVRLRRWECAVCTPARKDKSPLGELGMGFSPLKKSTSSASSEKYDPLIYCLYDGQGRILGAVPSVNPEFW